MSDDRCPLRWCRSKELARLRRDNEALRLALWAIKEAIEDGDTRDADRMIAHALRAATETGERHEPYAYCPECGRREPMIHPATDTKEEP
jgi:hypothetical protein